MYKFKSFTPISLFFLFYEMVFISKTLFHNLFIKLVVELFFLFWKIHIFFYSSDKCSFFFFYLRKILFICVLQTIIFKSIYAPLFTNDTSIRREHRYCSIWNAFHCGVYCHQCIIWCLLFTILPGINIKRWWFTIYERSYFFQ